MKATVVNHFMEEFSGAVGQFAAAAGGRYEVPAQALSELNHALGSLDGLDTGKLREAAHVAAAGGSSAASGADSEGPVGAVMNFGSDIAGGLFSRFFGREKDDYVAERDAADTLDRQMQQCCDAVDSIADDSQTALREIFLAAVPVLQVLTLLLGRSPWGVVASAAISAGSYLVERTMTTAQETCADRDEAISQCFETYTELCDCHCDEQGTHPPKTSPEPDGEQEREREPQTRRDDEPGDGEPDDEPGDDERTGPLPEPATKPVPPPVPVDAPGPGSAESEPAGEPPTSSVKPTPTSVPESSSGTEPALEREREINSGKIPTTSASHTPVAASPPSPAPIPTQEPTMVEPAPAVVEPVPEPEAAPEPTPLTSEGSASSSAGALTVIALSLDAILVDAATAAASATAESVTNAETTVDNTATAEAGVPVDNPTYPEPSGPDTSVSAEAESSVVTSFLEGLETHVQQAVASVDTESFSGILGLVGAGLLAVNWEACICCLESVVPELAGAEADALTSEPAAEPSPPVEPAAEPEHHDEVIPPPPELAEVPEPPAPPKQHVAPVALSPEVAQEAGPVATEATEATGAAESAATGTSAESPDPSTDPHTDPQTDPGQSLGEQRTRKAGTW